MLHALPTTFFLWLDSPRGPRPPHRWIFEITLRHTTLGRTSLDEWSTRRRDLYLTTHNSHKRQTSMSPAGFEPAIPTRERPQTRALDRATTGIGSPWYYMQEIHKHRYLSFYINLNFVTASIMRAMVAHLLWWLGYWSDVRVISVWFSTAVETFLFSAAFKPALVSTRLSSHGIMARQHTLRQNGRYVKQTTNPHIVLKMKSSWLCIFSTPWDFM